MQHDIAAAIQAVQAGAAPWQTVIDVQQTYYPRCVAHGVPTPMILDDTPVCAQCIADPAIQQRLRTLLPK